MDAYEEIANALCRDGVCRIGPHTVVDITREELIAQMKRKWPTEEELRQHVAHEGVAVSFHLQFEPRPRTRAEYEMTEDDLAAILEACKPVPLILIGGIAPRSQQERANDAWAALGSKMGFDFMTVQPVPGKGDRFFTAIPT